MVRDPRRSERVPELQAVLDALDDEDCRTIVQALEDPMTAQEIADVTDIPQSTAYRKLDLLSEATIVDERTEIRRDGHHTTHYLVDFRTVEVSLGDDRTFDLDITRPTRSPDEQLAQLWSEVRKET